MSRLLPFPWVSLAMFVGWLLLNDSVEPGHLLLGAGLALVIPRLMSPPRPRPGPIRRWGVLIRLVLRVGKEVVLSAIEVTHGIVQARRRSPRGAFVAIPMELRDAHALAALSMITAVIPGTVWTEIAADRSILLMHVFDLDDEATFIERFKRDYEHPLMEIFE